MSRGPDQKAKPPPIYPWGRATAFLQRREHSRWVDVALLLSLGGLIFGMVRLAREWTGTLRPTVEIDLSPWALPQYTLLSLSRGLAAYVLSFAFTLVYGYWAAKDKVAGRILIPLLDVLQSIPVLGFMPGLVLALVAAFPHSNVGLELAAVLMIFTGQAWNMTFSFYHSLRSVPADLGEAATMYGFDWKARLRKLELPFAAIGLVWNSMMSMAGGWFFLMINESFILGDKDFRLPGLGSYMSVAVAKGNTAAMVRAILAMTAMIVALDQLLWRPIVVWAQKFRVEEGGQTEAMRSWFLDLLRRSELLAWVRAHLRPTKRTHHRAGHPLAGPARARRSKRAALISLGCFLALLALMTLGAWKLIGFLSPVTSREWFMTVTSGFVTLGRVLIAVSLGTLWTLPAGLAIGLSPRLSRLLQPAVQVVASFPAPMLFPAVITVMRGVGISLGWGSVVLMLLGTQWYVLFNVVAGATAIPADLREAAHAFRMGRLQRFTSLYLPAVFPYLVTGWVTAAGGAWNASIVAEYVTFRGETISTLGLGARVSAAASGGHFPSLAASILVMSLMVVAFNRLVWRRMNALAERRFSLTR
ncbi:ABC transporter permease [Hyalangium versicolor]|uniref:ABC transporter permease n=1 Tax=Hyalangium versicolor TaxID=2861190 RepID=UPI001CCA7C69|nr:ABC transporter permease subunit [Hyalangium versicolor]